MMPMTGLERRAALKATVTLRETTMANAAKALGVSYNHLILVLTGTRQGSDRLERAIAEFVGLPVEQMFQNTPVGGPSQKLP
jgi:lambda repressor-like predicted transcriptional regulator